MNNDQMDYLGIDDYVPPIDIVPEPEPEPELPPQVQKPQWQDYEIILRTDDESYVIMKNDMPYHVVREGDDNALWHEIYNYTLQHPKQVLYEDPPAPLELTEEEILASFIAVMQNYLDEFARTRSYDNILSAASYAVSTNTQFASEGQYAVEMRDAVWAKGYQILDDVQAGRRPLPTVEQVISELPKLKWPV